MVKAKVMVSIGLRDLQQLAEAAADAQGLLEKKAGEGVRGLGGMIRRLDKVVPPVLAVCREDMSS